MTIKQRSFVGVGRFVPCAVFLMAMFSSQVSFGKEDELEGFHWVNSKNDVSGVFNVFSQDWKNDRQDVCEDIDGSYIPSLDDVGINGFATKNGTWGSHEYLSVAYATQNLVIPETLSYHRGRDNNVRMGPVRRLGYECFRGFDNLISVSIPSSIRVYSLFAFADCTSLQTVELHCDTISTSMFSGCTSLRHINIPDGIVTGISPRAFANSGLVDVAIPQSVHDIGTGAFSKCTNLTSVVIAEGVQTIGSQAFWDCTALRSITMPQSIDIGKEAFRGCTDILDVDIPNYASVRPSAFYGCSGLTNLRLHKGAQIENGAFQSCSGLKTITVENAGESAGETIIDYKAFTRCGSLESIFFTGNAPTIDGGYYEATYLYDVPSSCTVYVPRGSSGWGVDIPGKWYGLNIKYIDTTQPDLGPYKPNGWSAPIVVSESADTTTDAASITTNDPLYASIAFFCANADVSTRFLVQLYVDGEATTSWSYNNRTRDRYTTLTGDDAYYLGELSVGTHTIKMVIDSEDDVVESDEGNNVYTKTITVGGPQHTAYLITFDDNYSGGITAQMIFRDDEVITKSDPSPRPGYKFLGWYTARNGGTRLAENTKPTQSITHYAHWAETEFDFGDIEWTLQSDGSWRSGVISDNGSTYMAKSVSGAGKISFKWKTSSESGYDKLHFYVNGSEAVPAISGVMESWASVSYDVPAGRASVDGTTAILKWEYTKDGSAKDGSDCAWIKDVAWTPNAAPAQTYIVRLHRNNSERDGATAGRTYTIGKARALPKIQKELKWAPRKGYDFLGWARTADATTAQYTDGQSLKDLTKTAGATVHLYAVWKAHKYIVRLHRNNSKNDGATTGRAFDYDQVRFLPTMAEIKWARSGYMFLGWSLAQSSTTVKYADGLNVFNLSANDGEELHLWGVWKKSEANAYLLRLHRNNSERDGATAGRQLKLNTNRKLPTVRELGWARTDATFKGWATTAKNAAAGKVAYKDGATVKNLVKTLGDTAHIYAVWQ